MLGTLEVIHLGVQFVHRRSPARQFFNKPEIDGDDDARSRELQQEHAPHVEQKTVDGSKHDTHTKGPIVDLRVPKPCAVHRQPICEAKPAILKSRLVASREKEWLFAITPDRRSR